MKGHFILTDQSPGLPRLDGTQSLRNFADFLKCGNVAWFLWTWQPLLDSRNMHNSGFPEA